jgi:PBP1b-binding outer membrane lipoprotein LpoB
MRGYEVKKKILLIAIVLLIILTGCDGDAKEETQKVDQETAYAKFQSIDIQIEQNQINITGEADATENKFFYTVVQAEKEIGVEKEVLVDKKWGGFTISVPITEEMKNSNDVVIVNLYTHGSEGQIVNPNYVPIDLQMEMSGEGE